MKHGQKVMETTTGCVGTVVNIYTNTIGNTMIYVRFDSVGAIEFWEEWIPADLLEVME